MSTLMMVLNLLLAQADATNLQADAENDKIQYARWQTHYRSVAAQYKMEVGTEPSSKLKLQPDPVFSYANPAGGQYSHGAIFVWTRDGRPEMVGAIWSRFQNEKRSVNHEMHSLSLEPLRATREQKVFWAPSEPGVEPLLISNAPAPADTAPLRLTQMRNLAKEFSASTTRGTAERQLQIRPQPAYRWETPTSERDGALFLLFEDWDPELIIMIETRPTPGGPKWHASFARLTNLPAIVLHNEKQVWSFEPSPTQPQYGAFDKRFFCSFNVEVLPAILEK